MPGWVQWLNENWHHIVIPVAILVAFIIGGRWLRRIAYDRFDRWVKRNSRMGLVLFITRLYGPFLFWFVLLGIYVAARASVLPPEVIAIMSPVLLSLFVSSWIWAALSISKSITRLYLPRTRQYLARVKAPQPPTSFVVNGWRVIFIIIGAAILLSIWKLPNVNGFLVVIAAFTIGILALREASTSLSERLHLSQRTRARLYSVGKVFLSLLVVAGIADIIRRFYLIANTASGYTLDLVILFLEIGFVAWFISTLRIPNYRQAKPSFKLVTTLFIVTALILAFAGIQPLANYKDATVQYVNAQVIRINAFVEAQSSPGDTTDVVRKVSPAIVRLDAGDYVGTGMIIDKTGYVLTCEHVVEDNQTVNVMLHGGGQYSATVISRDQQKDLAIVKINAAGIEFPIVILGGSGELEIGQDIIVIGYSLGLEGETSISKGIVSAFRNDAGINYVQTDAAVNPGCSGGPLLDLNGEVVGVVTFKIADEEIEGMGFAVTIDTAKQFISRTIDVVNQEESVSTAEQILLEAEKETFRLINLERQERGIPPIQWNETLHSGARIHSKDMQMKGFLYHDEGGSFAECCYGASYASSIYTTAQGAVEGWMSSTAGHREILLDPKYGFGAVGIARDKGFWATYRCY